MFVGGTGVLLLGCLVFPVLMAKRMGRRLNAPSGRVATTAPLSLPSELQAPDLPGGLRPELIAETAVVLDLQTWSETSVSWQSSSGSAHQAPQMSVYRWRGCGWRVAGRRVVAVARGKSSIAPRVIEWLNGLSATLRSSGPRPSIAPAS